MDTHDVILITAIITLNQHITFSFDLNRHGYVGVDFNLILSVSNSIFLPLLKINNSSRFASTSHPLGSTGSPWRDQISLAILHLQEKGIIQMLYNKWWKNVGIVCQRDDKSKEGKANALGVDNIGGVFVVLLFGLAFAVITAIYEFVWHSRKLAKNSRVGYFRTFRNK